MFEEAGFEILLARFCGERQKIEIVRIFRDLLCQIGLQWRQSAGEIRDGLSLALVQAALDLYHEDVPAPTILNGLLDVPDSFGGRFHLVEQHTVVEPGQFCSKLLQN